MIKHYRIWLFATIVMTVNLLLAGCNSQMQSRDADKENSETVAEKQNEAGTVDKEAVRQTLQQMIGKTAEDRADAVVPESVNSVHFRVDNDLVNVDFDEGIYDVDNYGIILAVSKISQELCSIDNVNYVSFTVNGLPLHDSKNVAYGIFDADSFVENEGALINAYERAELQLYFANEDGSRLVGRRESLVYSSNIGRDRLVVEKIIEGPLSSGAFPTVNPNTTVNVVTTRDGVCYVDLSSDFLNKTTNVTDEVLIYSLVNSLTNLTGINKVQIMIDGKSEEELVKNLYERNLELVIED